MKKADVVLITDGESDTQEAPAIRQLAEQLQGEIASAGDADQLPTERQLMEAYRVSRHTVREALRDLRASGLLRSRRGRGTFVARATLEQPLHALYNLAESITSSGGIERSEVLRQEVVTDARVAARLGLPGTRRLARLDRLRFVDDEPVALVSSWFPAALGKVLLGQDLTRGAIYDLLAECGNVHVTGGSERISAGVVSAEESALLRTAPHEAVLLVERLALAGSTPAEWRRTVVRADRYSFVAQWGPPH